MSADNTRFTIRQMQCEDINTCLDIWREIGLNEGYQTVVSSFKSDPEGFYVAIDNNTGEIIGMCAGCMARPDTAFMGFYAVRPQYQKHGIGKRLWSQTTNRLSQNNTNIGLYGVDDMYAKYKKSGFGINDPARLCIYECEKDFKNIDLNSLLSTIPGYHTEKFDYNSSEELFKKLVEYDKGILHHSREKLLRLYLKANDCPLTMVAMKEETVEEDHKNIEESSLENITCNYNRVTDETLIPNNGDTNTTNSTLCGYGCIRADNTGGCMIGPIYADSCQIAELLLRKLIENYSNPLNNNVLIMSLTTNQQALDILTKVGFHEAEQCGRLFTKFIPSINYSKVYYIHSPNFSLF